MKKKGILILPLFFSCLLLICSNAFSRDNIYQIPALSSGRTGGVFTKVPDLTDLVLAQNEEGTTENETNKKTESYDELDDELDDDELDDDELDDDLFGEYDDTEVSESIPDPLYYFNYAMYSFNDALYFAVLNPLTTGYKAITPDSIRKVVNNFFYNLVFPIRFVNNTLQGKFVNAGREVEIFLINSTLGILGFGQPAQDVFDLQTSDEDLGQTLGSYTIGNGFYLVLPFFGPSTLRDTVGLVGDSFLSPLNYLNPWELQTGLKAYDTINSLSFRLGDYEAVKDAAIDPYIAFQDGYLQNRMKKLKE